MTPRQDTDSNRAQLITVILADWIASEKQMKKHTIEKILELEARINSLEHDYFNVKSEFRSIEEIVNKALSLLNSVNRSWKLIERTIIEREETLAGRISKIVGSTIPEKKAS